MAQVWEHSRQSGGSLLMLLALADFADDDGRCWPAVKTLAEKARMSERNARYVLRALEQAGEIATVVGGGRHGTSGYVVTAGANIAGAIPAGGQSLPGGKMLQKGGNPLPKRGQPIAPEPSRTIIEPPVQIATPPAPPTVDAPIDAIPETVPTFTATVVGAMQRAFPGVRLTQVDKPGRLLAWVKDIVIVLDERSGHDAGVAVASWDSWVDSEAWGFKGNDESRWARSLSDWLTNGRKARPARDHNTAIKADEDRTETPMSPETLALVAEAKVKYANVLGPSVAVGGAP